MTYAKARIKCLNSDEVREVKFPTETYVPVYDEYDRVMWINVRELLVGDVIGKGEQFEVLEVSF